MSRFIVLLLPSLLLLAACSSGPVEPRSAETSGATESNETLNGEDSTGPSADTPQDPHTANPPANAPPEPEAANPPPTAETASSPAVAPAPSARPPMSAQVLVLVAQMEEDLEAINLVRPFLMRIRTETTLPSEGAPLACRSDLRERMAELIRQGLGVATSGLSSLRDSVDDLCTRFGRWETPGEVERNSITRYRARLERIDEWMTDIRRCVDPGPYDFRCENTYGAQEPGDAEQAAAALAVVQEVRAVLVGVPQTRPFPCYSPVWRRVEATSWTMSVARAQIPGLATAAHSICEAVGVDSEALNEQVRRIHDRLDRSNASLVQLSESRQDTLIRMRAVSTGAP